MKRFTDAGRRALKDDNLYAALSLALMIPDICGSLEDLGPGKSQKRYERWVEKWFVPEYTPVHKDPFGNLVSIITSEQVYQLRCSLVHSGSDEIEAKKRTDVDRFFFFDQTMPPSLQKFTNCEFNGVKVNIVRLPAAKFCEDMFRVADDWEKAVLGDKKVQAEKDRLLYIHTKGDTIYGIGFG